MNNTKWFRINSLTRETVLGAVTRILLDDFWLEENWLIVLSEFVDCATLLALDLKSDPFLLRSPIL